MKNSVIRFAKILCLSYSVYAIAFLNTTVAEEAPQTNTNAAKVIPAAQKNPAPVGRLRAGAIQGKRNYLGVNAGVQTNLRPNTAQKRPGDVAAR